MGWAFFRRRLAGVCVPCYQPSCLSCFHFAMICNVMATRSCFISGKDDSHSVTSAPDMNTISVGSLVQKFSPCVFLIRGNQIETSSPHATRYKVASANYNTKCELSQHYEIHKWSPRASRQNLPKNSASCWAARCQFYPTHNAPSSVSYDKSSQGRAICEVLGVGQFNVKKKNCIKV